MTPPTVAHLTKWYGGRLELKPLKDRDRSCGAATLRPRVDSWAGCLHRNCPPQDGCSSVLVGAD
eukprot:1162078-Pelagomonas_calceolata.AAC.10